MSPNRGLRAVIKIVAALAGFLTSSIRAAAQASEADSVRAVIAAAEGAQNADSSARADSLYDVALTRARQLGDRGLEGVALLGLSRVAQQANPDSGFVLLEAAYRLFDSVGDSSHQGIVLNDVGLLLVNTGRPDSGLAVLRKALAFDGQDLRERGTTLGNFAVAFFSLGFTDSAAYYSAASAAIAQQVGDSSGQAFQLASLGAILWRLGTGDSSLMVMREALRLFRALRKPAGEEAVLQGIGTVYSGLGRFDSALVYLKSALDLNLKRDDRTGEAYIRHEVGMVYRNQRQADSALAYFLRAHQLGMSTRAVALAAGALSNFGLVLYDLGRSDSALTTFRRALELRRTARDRAGEGVTVGNIGGAFDQMGKFDSAATYYASAVAINRETQDRHAEAINLGNLGYAYGGMRRRDLAVAYFDSAAVVVTDIGRRAGGDESRTGYSELVVSVLDRAPFAWLDLADSIGAESAARRALMMAEQIRGQSFMALLRRAAPPDSSPFVLDPSEMPKRRETVLVYYTGIKELAIWAIGSSGRVIAVRQPVTRDSLAGLVTRARSALTGDAAGRGASRDRTIDRLVSRGSSSGTAERGRKWARANEDLSRLLMPPDIARLVRKASGIVIIPSGPLGLVPFTLLSLGDSGMVGASKSIRYGPTLQSLNQVELRPRVDVSRAELRHAVVVGNPRMPLVRNREGGAEQLPPLPAAQEEAASIARLLGSRALTGVDATEHTIKNLIGAAPLLHFATHGYAFATRAEARESFLAFAPGQGEDGLLKLGEILDDPRLAMLADLVVLSACQTGLGDPTQTEGTLGLQRGFLAKGARSVLVSLWNVSDEATRLLMQRFYSHWLKDPGRPGKAEALRRAQDDVRRTPGLGHPRQWAAFQLVGAN